MSPNVWILGGHQTDFARSWAREGLDISDMMRESIEAALVDARIDASMVDTVHVGNAFSELQRGQGHLGAMALQVVPDLRGKPAMRHEGACASSSLAVLAAMAEIEAGRYDVALVVGVEEQKALPGDRSSVNQNAAAWQDREGISCTFMWPAVFGLLAEEYAWRHGLDRAHLNRISEINYANAKRNPLAQTRDWRFTDLSFTDDDVANPLIEPGTRRQDCGQITDGAAALVLCSDRFMRDHASRTGRDASRTARILGWGHRNAGIRFLDKIEASRGDTHVFPHVRDTVGDAFRRAGVGDVLQLDGIETHDCFSVTEYMAIDHFGITAPGESWKAVESGLIERDGDLPVNPSGGLIGGGHPVGATGARMLLDAARQVEGRAGDTQVDGARTFGTLNIGGSLATVASFVVGVRD
ncbi:MAG: acetyl-CoA acetyltransferase [Ilumatobacteraceae bacterium]